MCKLDCLHTKLYVIIFYEYKILKGINFSSPHASMPWGWAKFKPVWHWKIWPEFFLLDPLNLPVFSLLHFYHLSIDRDPHFFSGVVGKLPIYRPMSIEFFVINFQINIYWKYIINLITTNAVALNFNGILHSSIATCEQNLK